MTTLYEVRQDSLLSLGDGNTPAVPLARMGFPANISKWDMFALAGRMFNLKQAVIGTMLNGSAADAGGVVLTAPTVRFTVPTGYTIFPRRFNLAAIPGATTAVGEIAIVYTAADSYTSGGVAMTPLNWRTDNPRTTVVTNCYTGSGSAITEAALTSVRALYQENHNVAAAFATSYELALNKVVQWEDLIPIVGPASFLIYISGANAVHTFTFSLDWAEVQTVNVKAG